MDIKELDSNAKAMVAPGKGILAADESTGTIKKRFDKIGLESSFESRRAYRELLFTAPDAEKHISGVILYDETLRQQAAAGQPFPQLLAARGILPGIKVDAGAKALAGFPGETVTEGLDGLRERLAEYHGLGARFAKWRAVIDIGAGIPTAGCLAANAEALARYAALCQEASIVPIVEPEVLMDGDHTHRALRGSDGCDARARLRRAVPAPRAPRGHGAEAEHGHRRQEVREAGDGRAGGRGHRALPAAARSRGGAGHRLPVGRAERSRGDAAPVAHEPLAQAAVGAVVQLRPRAAAEHARCLEGQGRRTSPRRRRPSSSARS